MPLTEDELQANYLWYVLFWIFQYSSPTITDFVAISSQFTLAADDNGIISISSWSENINCSQPSDSDMMGAFNPGDYSDFQLVYQIQQSANPLPTVTNSSMILVNADSTGIPLYTMIINTDTSELLIKTSSTNWSTIASWQEESKVSTPEVREIIKTPVAKSRTARTISADEDDIDFLEDDDDFKQSTKK